MEVIAETLAQPFLPAMCASDMQHASPRVSNDVNALTVWRVQSLPRRGEAI